MSRPGHVPLAIALTLALLTATAIGLSGTFVMFDDKGILSGPFSALLLISAAVGSLLILVILDWRIWQPQRITDETEFMRWLTQDILCCKAIVENKTWQNIEGTFHARRVILSRVAFQKSAAIRWSVETSPPSAQNVRIVRLDSPAPAGNGEYSSGDTDFDARYAWQTDAPGAFLPVLKNAAVRESIKRLASLFAQRTDGPGVGRPDNGISISNGRVSLLEHPAPLLVQGHVSAGEILLLLRDLSTLAAALEGREVASPAPPSAPATEPAHWLAVGCTGFFGVALWLCGSWALAHWLGMPAGMLGFFTPAMLLIFVFMLANAGKSGREAETEDVIRDQAAVLLGADSEMAQLATKLRMETHRRMQ